jgi:hypothetical protein
MTHLGVVLIKLRLALRTADLGAKFDDEAIPTVRMG